MYGSVRGVPGDRHSYRDDAGKVRIVGAKYDLHDGKVRLLEAK